MGLPILKNEIIVWQQLKKCLSVYISLLSQEQKRKFMDYYKALSISPNATLKEVEQQYDRLLARHANEAERLQEVKKAYQLWQKAQGKPPQKPKKDYTAFKAISFALGVFVALVIPVVLMMYFEDSKFAGMYIGYAIMMVMGAILQVIVGAIKFGLERDPSSKQAASLQDKLNHRRNILSGVLTLLLFVIIFLLAHFFDEDKVALGILIASVVLPFIRAIYHMYKNIKV